MKRPLFLLALCHLLASVTFAQQTLIAQADAYYQKRDFEKAFEAYDRYYADTAHGKSNFDTYHAAIAACNIGKPEQAKAYLRTAIRIGFHYAFYQQLSNDPYSTCISGYAEWKKLIEELRQKRDSAELVLSPIRRDLFDSTLRVNASAISNGSLYNSLMTTRDPAMAIRSFKDFPVPKKTGYWTLYTVKIDTLEVPFLLYIPRGYDGRTKIPLNVFLHGAVSGKSTFYQDPALTVNGLKVILRKQLEQNSFIIWPYAKAGLNWLQHQKAFDAVLEEIAKVKSLYNIDDNRVYLGGHSDGGAGAFWFALNRPTTFAGIFALNYFPQVVTGGNTNLANLNSQLDFLGISGTRDTGMPLSYITPIYQISRENGANWTNFQVQGDHRLPYEMPDSLDFLYERLFRLKRDPFPKKVEWQTDDLRNGRSSWIAISGLDTLAQKASWHKEPNPTIDQNGKPVVLNYNRHRSGAVIATCEGNNIDIRTSRVAKITLYLCPGMFDLKRRLRITINGGKTIERKIKVDPRAMADEFARSRDRVFLVAGTLELTIGEPVPVPDR